MLKPTWTGQSYGQYNLPSQISDKIEYNPETAKVIAQVMTNLNNMCHNEAKTKMALFIQTYLLNKGIKKFGNKGYQSAFSEMH